MPGRFYGDEDRSKSRVVFIPVADKEEMAAAISQLSPAGGLLFPDGKKKQKASGGLRFPPDPLNAKLLVRLGGVFTCHL